MRPQEKEAEFWISQELWRGEWDMFPFSLFQRCPVDQARGKERKRLNELFAMLDTETSKSHADTWTVDEFGLRVYDENPNYIVAWTLSICIYGHPVCCLRGRRPSEIIQCMTRLHESLRGDSTIIYWHNWAYDYMALRKFLFMAYGEPVKTLNTKPHYPIIMEFNNGLQMRDSLILAQRKLERWAEDMDAPHKKAVGNWDYEAIRNQDSPLTDEEWLYVDNDTLAGVECLSRMQRTIGCTIRGMPFTATGVVRNEARERGRPFQAHKAAINQYNGFEQYERIERVYHGGFTHANRHVVDWTIDAEEEGCCITAYDFASSYPYCMLTTKMPCEKFTPLRYEPTTDFILRRFDEEAFIFRFEARNIRLKDPDWPFPIIQVSKVGLVVDAVSDNGRIMCAGYLRMDMNEFTFKLIHKYYDWDECRIYDCLFAAKDYLPRWLRDYVYELFQGKTTEKGGDAVLYAILKAKLNSVYGMCVQKVLKNQILEDYATGDYHEVRFDDPAEEFEKVLKRQSTFLQYNHGVYVTAAAQYNLFQLIECTQDPVYDALYCDTDSCYGLHWNEERLAEYNASCRRKLTEQGYGSVMHNDKEYWLGVAALDGEYTQFRTLGAKRYCCREKESGKLKITVAGVPKKKGALCLNDDINNFKPGFVFRGEITGKLTHLYQYVDAPYIDEHGNEVADSINLIPCDYLLDKTIEQKIDSLFFKEVEIQIYGDE